MAYTLLLLITFKTDFNKQILGLRCTVLKLQHIFRKIDSCLTISCIIKAIKMSFIYFIKSKQTYKIKKITEENKHIIMNEQKG